MGVATWSLSDPSWGICQAVVVLGAWSDGGQAGDCHWGACCKMREAAQGLKEMWGGFLEAGRHELGLEGLSHRGCWDMVAGLNVVMDVVPAGQRHWGGV